MMKSDFIVIGSGIAGLNFALDAAKYGSVFVITKKEIMESNTNKAQGGVAAVLSKKDSFDSHIADTLRVGEGLCDRKAVEVLVKEGPGMIKRLVDFGVGFNKCQGHLCLAKEGGHSKRRIVYAKDATGAEIERALVFNVRNNRNIKVFENHIAIDLITKGKRCIGVSAFDIEKKKLEHFFSKAVVVATGGIGNVFEKTSNPRIATGDGIAMAYLAGAEIADMEFMQFHPTTLDRKGTFLISETVRGEGAILRNAKGEAFMEKYHPLKDLAPRDTVARAIINESKKGKVYLDMTHKDSSFIRHRFPTIYAKLKEHGIDMTNQKIPITPAAHYLCGGIKTDINGRASIEGLYAFGECACTFVHGANRLASNSLLESLVFSSRALKDSIRFMNKNELAESPVKKYSISRKSSEADLLKKKIKKTMWQSAGIIREKKGLLKGIEEMKKIDKRISDIFLKGINEDVIEARNMAVVALLVLKSALKREESRGTHYRSDFPMKRKEWERHVVLRKA